jgi:two-component system nitrogen regulation response regulator GlnG
VEGKFREDLFHRLNVIRIHMPSLNERREDIPLLTQHFMSKAAVELEVEPKSINKSTQKVLNQLEWPGNVRQLENLCRWLTVMASGKEVHTQDLPPELHQSTSLKVQPVISGDWQTLLASWADQQLRSGQSNILSDTTPEFEKIMLDRALHYTRGRKQEAAKLLGWGRNTLTRKLKEFDM